MAKIVLLMKFGNVAGLEYLKALKQAGVGIHAIVFQGDTYSLKDRGIFEARTEGKYKPLFLGDVLDVYEGGIHFVKKHNSSQAAEILKSLNPDIFVFGGVDIIDLSIIKIARYGAINTHPGSLPKYRGCCAVEWSIWNDDPIVATCHLATDQIDFGSILYAAPLKLKIGDTYADIRARMVAHQANVMVEGLKTLISNPNQINIPTSKGQYRNVMSTEQIQIVLDKISNKTYKPLLELADNA